MLEIDTDLIWTANAVEARSPKLLFDMQIEAVVDLAYEEEPALLPRSITFLRVPLTDGGDNAKRLVRLALKTTTGLICDGVRTVVACSAGMSRSPTIASFATANALRSSAYAIIDQVSRQKQLDISSAFFKQVERVNAEMRRGDTC